MLRDMMNYSRNEIGAFFEGYECALRRQRGEIVTFGNGHGADMVSDGQSIEVKASRVGKDNKYQVLLQQKDRTTIWDKNILVVYTIGRQSDVFFRTVFYNNNDINPNVTIKVTYRSVDDLVKKLARLGLECIG